MYAQTTQFSVLDAAMEATRNVLPNALFAAPVTAEVPYVHNEMSVLIGVLGDVRGSLVIGGKSATFSAVGEQMYGMALEGEMLESFVGELGNMIAGNMATHVSKQGITMDITPPTVIVGEAKLGGFESVVSTTARIGESAELYIILLVGYTQ